MFVPSAMLFRQPTPASPNIFLSFLPSSSTQTGDPRMVRVKPFSPPALKILICSCSPLHCFQPTAFVLLVGGVILALSLALGLGSREWVQHCLQAKSSRADDPAQ